MNEVFILWHVHEFEESGVPDEEKLIGVYGSHDDAEAARSRLVDKPGFRDLPDHFQIHRYEIGKDGWTEGYISAAEAESE